MRRVVDWAPIRADFESRVDRIDDVAARHGVSKSGLMRHARDEMWERPRGDGASLDRGRIIVRLFRVLELQVVRFEKEAVDMGENAKTGEAEVTILGRLAGNLEKLIALDEKAARRAPDRPESRAMRDIKDRLARRIAQLRRG